MSNLDDLYREIILDHYRTPRNRGELPAPAIKAEGFNPLCGDEITVYLDVEDGVVKDIKISGQGCSISQASSSLMSAAVKGKTIDEARETILTFKRLMGLEEAVDDEPVDLRKLGEIAALAGVVKFPVRIKCATLAWNTLTEALTEQP
jgi:nitrogen fixation protein NifU and related proteins